MKIRDVDSMKFRNSTHLAGVDVEIVIQEKGKCIMTIDDAYYTQGEVVNGKKLEGYYIKFKEHPKRMKVNSTNRQIISDIVRKVRDVSRVDSRNLKNWVNIPIELYFKENVQFARKTVGGIRVRSESPIPQVSDKKALKVIGSSKTQEELKANWGKITRNEQALPSVTALKDKLKKELK